METSPTIGKLTTALAKAQGEIRGATKDSTNPHFKSKYADLASVRDAIQGSLSKNGIAYIQFPEGGPETVKITTVLALGDEWVRASYEMRPVKADPQGVGSAITYARRYALMAAVGVAPEDDDGNAASHTNGHVARPALAPSPSDEFVTKLKKTLGEAPTIKALQTLWADAQVHLKALDPATVAACAEIKDNRKEALSPREAA
jgi:hypothetical protein